MKILSQIKPYLTLLSMSLLISMVTIDVTSVNLSLVNIAQELHASMAIAQWVIVSYAICLGAFCTLGSRLLEIIPRKKMLLFVCALFAISSLFIGFSSSIGMVILGRVVQGISASLMFPIISVNVFTAFTEEKRGFAMGTVAGVSSIAQGFGPYIGGVFITYLSWHWIFYINLPIVIVGLAIAEFSLDKQVFSRKSIKFDFIGMMLIVSSILILLLTMSEIPRLGILSLYSISGIALSVILLFAFLAFEKNKANPFIDLQLFKNVTLMTTIITRAVLQFGFFAVLFTFAVYFQKRLSVSVLDTAYILMGLSLAMGVVSPFAGKALDKLGGRFVLSIGVLLELIGAIFLFVGLFVSGDIMWLLFIIGLICYGLGLGLLVAPSTTLAMQSVSPEKIQAAVGLQYSLGFIASGFGVAVSGLFVNNIADMTVALRGILIVTLIIITYNLSRVLKIQG